jgi:hypothetical protein
MRRYGLIATSIWQDPRFRALEPETQRFYLYLWTSHHSTSWGAYLLPDLYIQADLNLSAERIQRCWDQLIRAGMVLRDKQTNLVALLGWFDLNRPTNAKSGIACINGIRGMAASDVLTRFIQGEAWLCEHLDNSEQISSEELANSSLTKSEEVAKSSTVNRTVTEQEQEQEPILTEGDSAGSSWLALRSRIESAYGLDRGIANFVKWFANTFLCGQPNERMTQAIVHLDVLISESVTKDEPVKWTQWAVQRQPAEGGFGYRPAGHRRAG